MSRTFIEILDEMKDLQSELENKIFDEVVCRPTSEWIPCTEKLPDNGEKVLVFLKPRTAENINHYDIGIYDDTGGWALPSSAGHFSLMWEPQVDVIAWQPLPEPYEEEQKGADDV